VVPVLQLLEHLARDAEVKLANLGERRVALRGNPGEITLTVRFRRPVVARITAGLAIGSTEP
jgi:hypothetical protein